VRRGVVSGFAIKTPWCWHSVRINARQYLPRNIGNICLAVFYICKALNSKGLRNKRRNSLSINALQKRNLLPHIFLRWVPTSDLNFRETGKNCLSKNE